MIGTLQAEQEVHKHFTSKMLEDTARKPYGSECSIHHIEFAQISSLFSADANVIEYGCADGWLCGLLSKRGNKCIGLDISEYWISLAKKNWPNSTFIVETFDYFFYNPVDVVIWNGSFHHSISKHRSLEASFNSLKFGGLLIINEPGLGFTWQSRVRKNTNRVGVTDRDCPPLQTIYLGYKAGFCQAKVYPALNTYIRRGTNLIALTLGKYLHGLITMRKPLQ
jgi:SAM-dependent methyltransferase